MKSAFCLVVYLFIWCVTIDSNIVGGTEYRNHVAGIFIFLFLLCLQYICWQTLDLFCVPCISCSDAELPKFKVQLAGKENDPPTINVLFANGHEDELNLKHYKLQELSVEGCYYIGNLRSTPTSSVAVTGCLKSPEDKMEITLISDHSPHKMFAVDMAGNTLSLSSPFEEGGRPK